MSLAPANTKAWSLRGRVLLLAGSAVLLLLLTLGILAAVLRNSQAALVNNAAAHLDRVAARAAAAYQARSDRSFDLQSLQVPPHPAPPPPPPSPDRPPSADDPSRGPGPQGHETADRLSSFLAGVLHVQPGMRAASIEAARTSWAGTPSRRTKAQGERRRCRFASSPPSATWRVRPPRRTSRSG